MPRQLHPPHSASLHSTHVYEAVVHCFNKGVAQHGALAEVALNGNAGVTQEHMYRERTIASLPSLRLLDGKRVSDEERRMAVCSLFPEPPFTLLFHPTTCVCVCVSNCQPVCLSVSISLVLFRSFSFSLAFPFASACSRLGCWELCVYASVCVRVCVFVFALLQHSLPH